MHLPNLARRDDAVITAVVDPVETPGVHGLLSGSDDIVPMDKLAQKYDSKWYKTLDVLLADKSCEIDGVVVCSQHALHTELGVMSLKAGKHVLIDKPMTADIDQAIELAKVAKDHPHLATIVNNSANWADSTIAAYDAVKQGKIGEVRHVNCILGSPLTWLFDEKGHAGWNSKSDKMLGNGFGWGQGSHQFGWIF